VSIVACGSETSERLGRICESFRSESLAVYFLPTYIGLGGTLATAALRGRARSVGWSACIGLAVAGLVVIVVRTKG
jgi:hypothetical protein